MAKLSSHFLLILSIFTILEVSRSDPILSCSQTPYPQVCSSLLSTYSPQIAQWNSRSSFRDRALRATIDRVVLVHRTALSTDLSSFDAPSKAAWADCLDLCEDTINQLNRSMTSSSSFDNTQSWLSAAMANQQTCRNGFIDFGSTFHLPSSPFMAGNITEAISNALAINKAMARAGSGSGNRQLLSDGFPKWVSLGDRKLLQSSTVNANLVVAQDGSGNYKTISEAVAASVKLRSGTARFVIHVKAGVYNEIVEITDSMKNLMLIGDGIDATVVTGSKNVIDGSTTFRSATVAVTGDGFIAQDMTFENTAGPQKHQAVALRSGSPLSVFYRCSFKGYQDTLYVHSKIQFYRNCDIYGTVDFIFGDATVVLQSCNIYARAPMSKQKITVTAQARTDLGENTGISIHNSVITAASDLQAGSVKAYLGRPWEQYSTTVIMKSSIGDLIDPAGWLEWDGDFALSTLNYGEYMNTGAGAGTSGRVSWPGYHAITSAAEAGKFTVGNFLSGDSWIPATGVPFTSGL